MKRKVVSALVCAAMVATMVAGCGSSASTDTATDTAAEETTDEAADATADTAAADGDAITIGFAQVGHESDWRTASTKSCQDVFSAANGYDLQFVDCVMIPLLSWKQFVDSLSRMLITSLSIRSYLPDGTLFLPSVRMQESRLS